jgi:hypothetical protein
MRLPLPCRFCWYQCVPEISVWGLAVAIAVPPPPHSALTCRPPGFLFAEPISHGRGQIWPQICGQSRPTGHEVTDFKKAVSVRINLLTTVFLSLVHPPLQTHVHGRYHNCPSMHHGVFGVSGVSPLE